MGRQRRVTRFPSLGVSEVLLQSIAYFPHCAKAISYGLCQLSPAMREQPELTLDALDEEAKAAPKSKVEQIQEQLQKSEMRAVLHRDGCLSKNAQSRKAALMALSLNRCVLYPQSNLVKSRVWILCHDVNDKFGTATKAKE